MVSDYFFTKNPNLIFFGGVRWGWGVKEQMFQMPLLRFKDNNCAKLF